MKTYSIPFRLTLSGDLLIEADSKEEAVRIAADGEWEDTSFFERASHDDWEVLGKPKIVDS